MTRKNNRLDMVRDPYRALLKTGRTYAAFVKETTLPLIDELKHHKTIIDPMAGFGGLMSFCSEIGISTFNIEYNPPTYLWSVLNNPKYSFDIVSLIDDLIQSKRRIQRIKKRADVSESWFSPLSYETIADLFKLIYRIAARHIDEQKREEISLAVLLPFVGRLSCSVSGNIVTHVKPGGICIYEGFREDFDRYLLVLKTRLSDIGRKCVNKNQEVVFGDLRTIKLEKKYSAFITSPPYPNSRDYYKMFAPENDCLLFLQSRDLIKGFAMKKLTISCSSVSKYPNKNIDYIQNISSKSAQAFIKYIIGFSGSKTAEYDNRVYYAPYFGNYFCDIEQAYRNFANYLQQSCEGYVVVINNTARRKVIPLAESIIELFDALGFKAKINEKYTRELSHVGSINPKVKGFKARHMEYAIKVWRE